MVKISEVIKKIFVPELSLIAFFVAIGYTSGNVRHAPLPDLSTLFVLVLVCFFGGAQILQSFLDLPKQDIQTPHKIVAILALIAILIPPFISFGQGWNAFLVTVLMFIFVVGFGIPRSYLFKKAKQMPGLDVMLRSITWGCFSVSMGALYSGLEPITRSWLVVLLSFYIYASFYLMIEMQSSKPLSEKPNLLIYLSESRSIELVALLQLFGAIGLTTLYLSEYDAFNNLNLTFYVLFTLISLINIFNALVWSKDPSAKRRFNYILFIILINLSLACWVVAEWFYI